MLSAVYFVFANYMIALTFYWCNIANKVVFLLTIIIKLQDNDPLDL